MRSRAHVPAIDAEAVWRAVAMRKRETVGGQDSWRTVELQALPVFMYEGIAMLFAAIEAGCPWPRALAVTSVSLILKHDGVAAAPTDLRPIACTAVLRATYATLRFSHLGPWMRAVFPPQVKGCPESPCIETALITEEAAGTADPVVCLMIGLAKCFDTLNVSLLNRIFIAMGGPPEVATAFESPLGIKTSGISRPQEQWVAFGPRKHRSKAEPEQLCLCSACSVSSM